MATLAGVFDRTARLLHKAPQNADATPRAGASVSPELLKEMSAELKELGVMARDLQEDPEMRWINTSRPDPEPKEAAPPQPRQGTYRGRPYAAAAVPEEPSAPARPAHAMFRGRHYAPAVEPTAPEPAAPVAPAPPAPVVSAPVSPAAAALVPPALQQIYQQAGVPGIPCAVEEVSQLVAKYRDFDPEMARRAILAALEFRPGASVDGILEDGDRKLAALESFAAAREQEARRRRAEADALLEQARSRTRKAIAELEAQIAELRQRGEAEVEAMRLGLAEKTKDSTEMSETVREEHDRIREVLQLLRPAAAAHAPVDKHAKPLAHTGKR